MGTEQDDPACGTELVGAYLSLSPRRFIGQCISVVPNASYFEPRVWYSGRGVSVFALCHAR